MRKTSIPCPCDAFKDCPDDGQKKNLCNHCRLVLKYEIVEKRGKRVFIDEDNAYRRTKKS